MASIGQGSQPAPNTTTEAPAVAGRGYEPPVVVATFGKDDLGQSLPENLTPHVHAVQSS